MQTPSQAGFAAFVAAGSPAAGALIGPGVAPQGGPQGIESGTGSHWYCVDGVRAEQIDPANVPTYQGVLVGPFDTRLKALAACGQGGAPPAAIVPPQPTPIQPPPPTVTATPPPPPPADCGHPCFTVPKLDITDAPKIQRMGGKDWCVAMPALMGALKVIGSTIFQTIEKAVEKDYQLPCPPPKWFQDGVGKLPFGIGSLLCSLWNLDASLLNSIIRMIRNVNVVAVVMARSITCDDPEITVALIVLRGIVGALKRLRVGTDAGLWATVDIHIEWDQVDAALQYLINVSCPFKIPGVSEAMAAYAKDRITQEQYECWMTMNAADPTVYDGVFQASRQRPGFTERQTMLYRLRRGVVNDADKYEESDFQADLQYDGLAPEWRNRLYAIRYSPYTIREIRQLLDTQAIGAADAHAAFRDMGFDEERAATLTAMEMTLTARRRAVEIGGYTPQRIAQFYLSRQITKDDVHEKMKKLGYTEEQADALPI